MNSAIASVESLPPVQTRRERGPRTSSTQCLLAVVAGIVVALVLAVVLVNALAWLLVLLVYIAQLRWRKPGQRAQLAHLLGIPIPDLKQRKVVGFFHPYW